MSIPSLRHPEGNQKSPWLAGESPPLPSDAQIDPLVGLYKDSVQGECNSTSLTRGHCCLQSYGLRWDLRNGAAVVVLQSG
ncbi:unnamed protein product [Boreogadus saida]